MSYRIRKQKSVLESVQKIALEQIDQSIADLDDSTLDAHQTVHEVRKRCKKIRGVLRLVRPQFEKTYQRENAWYRDAARTLSDLRDAQSMITCFDKLLKHYEGKIEREQLTDIRQQLTDRKQHLAEDETGIRDRLAEFRDRMERGREQIPNWELKADGLEAILSGVIKTYTRGRDAMRQAYQKPTAENFHEWRKRVKSHRYHMQLLRPLWPGPLEARANEADDLGSDLGDDHDLAILHQHLTDDAADDSEEQAVSKLLDLIIQRQAELRIHARPLGARLFAEKPKRFARRLEHYWNAWRSEVEAQPRRKSNSEVVQV